MNTHTTPRHTTTVPAACAVVRAVMPAPPIRRPPGAA
jgi:hypothetical protein